MACLDTTVILDVMGRGTPDAQRGAEQRLEQLHAAGEMLSTTRMNVAELWVGVFRSADPARELARVEDALVDLIILDLDQQGAELFGEIKAHLLGIGRPIGDMDILIAAVARANGDSLVTRNVTDFQNIPGLAVQGY